MKSIILITKVLLYMCLRLICCLWKKKWSRNIKIRFEWCETIIMSLWRRNRNEIRKGGVGLLQFMLIRIPINIVRVMLILTKKMRLKKMLLPILRKSINRSLRRSHGVFLIFLENLSVNRKLKSIKTNFNNWTNSSSHWFWMKNLKPALNIRKLDDCFFILNFVSGKEWVWMLECFVEKEEEDEYSFWKWIILYKYKHILFAIYL